MVNHEASLDRLKQQDKGREGAVMAEKVSGLWTD